MNGWFAMGVLALATAGGAYAEKVYRDGLDAQAALAKRESDDEAQRLATRNATRITDALTKDRLATERRAADSAERLRQLADATPAPAAACPGRNDDPRPAAGVLHDETRSDLVQAFREADAVADRLRACLSWTDTGRRRVDPPEPVREGGRWDR